MTRDDVIRMARKARSPVNHPDWADAAERFAALVAAHEREECAKVCSAQVQIEKYGHAAHAALMCENAIRARGTHEA